MTQPPSSWVCPSCGLEVPWFPIGEAALGREVHVCPRNLRVDLLREDLVSQRDTLWWRTQAERRRQARQKLRRDTLWAGLALASLLILLFLV